jgi:imidazolonepropionase-like amidohydrolase/enterochelin esterase-like enzyme
VAAIARPVRVVLFACAAAALSTGPAAAQSRIYHIRSRILSEDRVVRVSVPPNYAIAKQRYQVTYLLDGQVKAFYDLTVAAAGYDLVGDIHDYAIPPQIVIGVEQKDRGSDLGRNHDAFHRFLAEEVVPFVDREFRTVPYRTLIGHSLGGRFALDTFCRNPGMFSAVIAISPGIGDSTAFTALADCLRRDFVANRSVVRQLVFTAGDRETRLAASAARLRGFLRDSAPPNWRWTFVDGPGLGHTETPYVAIPRGIRVVHDRTLWEMPDAQADSVVQAKVEPDRAIAAWYRTLSARMGYEVAPSSKWLKAAAAAHLARHELAAAEEAAMRAVTSYPEDIAGYASLTDAYLASGNTDAARRTLAAALRTLERMEFFDEADRSLKRTFLRETLDGLKGPPEDIAFTHVNVIDGTAPTPRPDQTVIVRGSHILSVAPATAASVPPGARVVDGRGKYLLPGFWDMHVHTSVPGGRGLLAAYVANGVTGVRDMAGDWSQLTRWRDEIARGELAGPRIVASGPYLEGGDVPIAHVLARNPKEARAAVDSLARLGVDFVKVHGQLTRETYFAIARAARDRGLVFAGHVPRVVGAADASDSGQRSIEHLLTIPTPCTPAESLALRPRFTMQAALGRCSSEALAPLFERFVRNGTWVTPTFVAQYEIAVWPKRDVPGDAYASYLPDTLRRFVAEIFPMPDSIPPDADVVGRAIFEKRLALVGTMRGSGVRILAGTDAPLRNSPPGFGLHEELAFLSRAGLSPIEVLRSATMEPARYFGILDSAGTVAPGKVADLVLLDANPLADIRNTRRVATVVANGRLFERAALRALLAGLTARTAP